MKTSKKENSEMFQKKEQEKMKIMNLTMPKSGTEEWTAFQVAELPTTYFRFRIPVDKPVLDTSMFDDSERDPAKKHKDLLASSELYKDVQKALDEYIANLKAERIDKGFKRWHEEIGKMSAAQQLLVLSRLLEFIDDYFTEVEDRELVIAKVDTIIEQTKSRPL